MQKSEYVFVYGSLKKGFYNHSRFGMDMGKFVKTAVLSDYAMYDLGKYPCIVPSPNGSDEVHGEIWRIPEKVFNTLALIEHGAGFTMAHMDIEERRFFFFKKKVRVYLWVKLKLNDLVHRKVPTGIWTKK